MILLILFAFFAGIVTILSPCILPILPIVLSGSMSGNKHRPLGIVFGFIASFTFFTLFLSFIVNATGISGESLRFISIGILCIFGISLLVPKLQVMMETFFSSLSGVQKTQSRTGFLGGILIGLSLGLLWTPCVGPILAAVISLALTNSVTIETFVITLAYAIGTAIPMWES
jgi:cytochrome c biogenesis protein CcdA